jgi:hypothetical protein
LPGESPGRVRVSHPPVSSVAPAAEPEVLRWRTKQVKRTQRILQAAGVTAYPESWYSFEMKFVADGEGVNEPEAHRQHPSG